MDSLRTRVAAGQFVGDRERQEDNYAVAESTDGTALVLVLADGMGGHSGGAEAAHCAVAKFIALTEEGQGDWPSRLYDALVGANLAVGEMAASSRDLEGAGSTLIGAVVQSRHLHWISVGDSSVLLYRDGMVTRLNDDHSMRPVHAAMVEDGRMTAEEAAAHPYRNSLRSAVTGDELELIDRPREGVALFPGDAILIASDGLDTIDYDAIAAVLNRHAESSNGDTVTALLKAVQSEKRPRQDNTTLMLYREPGRGRPTRTRTERVLVWVVAALALATVVVAVTLFVLPASRPLNGVATSHPRLRQSIGTPSRPHALKPQMHKEPP